jgi:hypothetical protein
MFVAPEYVFDPAITNRPAPVFVNALLTPPLNVPLNVNCVPSTLKFPPPVPSTVFPANADVPLETLKYPAFNVSPSAVA